MDIESLRTLVDLMQTGSFSATANRLSVTQSAVSQRIRNLETNLGVALVVRSAGRHGLVFTPEGSLAVDAARQILDLEAKLRLDLMSAPSTRVADSLRVGTVYSMGLHSFRGVFAEFLARFPEVPLHVEYLRTDRIYEALRAGDIDCGVVACPRARGAVKVVPLQSDTMVVVSARPDPGDALLSVEESLRRALVTFDRRIPTRRLIDKWLLEHGIAASVVGEFDNVETIKQKVLLTAGVAVLPEPTVRREVEEGSLIIRPWHGAPLLRPTGLLVCANNPRPPSIDLFVNLALEARPG